MRRHDNARFHSFIQNPKREHLMCKSSLTPLASRTDTLDTQYPTTRYPNSLSLSPSLTSSPSISNLSSILLFSVNLKSLSQTLHSESEMWAIKAWRQSSFNEGWAWKGCLRSPFRSSYTALPLPAPSCTQWRHARTQEKYGRQLLGTSPAQPGVKSQYLYDDCARGSLASGSADGGWALVSS